MMKRPATSYTTGVAALVTIVAIVAAAVLFTSGDAQLERLAVLVGVVGLVIPSITASLRSDQAASSSHQAAEQTNGSLDKRIADAVAAAVAATMQARRSTDRVVVTEAPRPVDPLDVTPPVQ